MIINFRQGIVSYPQSAGTQHFLTPSGSYVSLNTANGVVDVAFAHKTTNYLHTEYSTVVNAWGPFPAATYVWLYWDINTLTGARTFGYTELEPIVQNTAPIGVDQDQHWFDTAYGIMKVWTGTRWYEKIRVFAAEYDTAAHTFTSVSVLSNQQRFDGTQVGIQNQPINTGRIIVDNAGKPITNQSNLFFTTEDNFFINGSPINTIRLEANILTAQPVENIAGYQVVKFTQFGKVSLASYHDLGSSAIAISVQDVLLGDIGSFVVQGIITNPNWNWSTVGSLLWVETGGTLVEYDPHTNDNVTYNVGKAPVGRVIDRHSIVFDQGLGMKGDKGESALSSTGIGEAATIFDLGKVKLTANPTDPGSPFAVETNDPRMSDARVPLQHIHNAAEVVPLVFGTSINGTLQTSLENLDSIKVNKTGDTMTGQLILSGDPTTALGATPKQYVDLFIPKTQRGAANGVATLDGTGKITQSQLPQIAITDTFVVGSQADMLLLNAQVGDVAVRTDIHTSFILKGSNASVLADWQELLTSPDGVVYVDVVPTSGQQGITTSGGPITTSGVISISLANDLAAVEALVGNGVAHRTGTDTWEVKAVDMGAGGSVVTGTLPMLNGGTGISQAFGYLKGNGTTYTTSLLIPGTDISGTVPAAATVMWSGVTDTPSALAGYGITNAYTKTETNALTWNWSSITGHPTTLVGYGITDVYSKTEVNSFLLSKANTSTTLAGYGITDASLNTHNHLLDSLLDVNTSTKVTGDLLSWSGTNWAAVSIASVSMPTLISDKIIDDSNTITVRDNLFTVVDGIDTTKKVKFELTNIPPNTTYTYTAPTSSGTLALSNGYGASGNWNINAATATAALTVPWSGITTTPVTLAGYGITNAYTKTETDNLTWDWSAISGQPSTLNSYGITDAYTKTETDNLTWNWSAISGQPATLAGYGITNAYTKTETDNLTWDWSAISGQPSTLAGYGITDAASLTHTHTGVYLTPADIGDTVAGLDFTGKVPEVQLPDFVQTRTYTVDSESNMLALSQATQGDLVIRTDTDYTYVLVTGDPSVLSNWTQIRFPSAAGGTVTSVDIVQPTAGITVSGGPIISNGTFTVALSDDLNAIENLTTTGFVKRTGPDTWSTTATVNVTELTGVVPIDQGGTNASTAPLALFNLGGVPFSGTGAVGTWSIDTSGNAATVSNGVYDNILYDNPSWLNSLAPEKVVSTWAGSTNIDTVGANTNFGNFTEIRNSSIAVSGTTPTVITSFSGMGGGKYLIRASCSNTDDVCIIELFVAVSEASNVYVLQTSTGTTFTTLTASYNVGLDAVEVIATASITDEIIYKINGTLFRL